jgi:hypothetical protein
MPSALIITFANTPSVCRHHVDHVCPQLDRLWAKIWVVRYPSLIYLIVVDRVGEAQCSDKSFRWRSRR